MTAIKDFLGSPLFYLALAVVAIVIVLIFVRLRKMRLSEVEVGIPPKVKFQPRDKPTETIGPSQTIHVADEAELQVQQRMSAVALTAKQDVQATGKAKADVRQEM